MSASLVVDLGNTCDFRPSVIVASGSDLTVGNIVDLLGADTNTQVFVAAGPVGGSGIIEVRIQTADVTTSGDFSEPTSGKPAGSFNTKVTSGGVFFTNSGLYASGYSSPSAPVDDAPLFCSGGIDFAHFQRPHRYARLILNSGSFPGPIIAGFLGQKLTVGSGGGFTLAPGSGSVNV